MAARLPHAFWLAVVGAMAGSCGPAASVHRVVAGLDAAPEVDGAPEPAGTGGTGGTPGDDGGGGTGDSIGAPPDATPPPMDARPEPDRPADAPRPPDARPVDLAPPPPDLPPDLPPPPDAAPPDVPPSPLAVGLVSRWKLDEGTGTTAADDADTGNDGTLTGATWISPGFPGARYPNPAALHFDGAGNHVDLGLAKLPAMDQPQSIAFWLRFAMAATGTAHQVAVGLSTDAGGRIKIGLRDGGIAMWRAAGAVLSAAASTNVWHHVVYSYDGTTQRLYLDGAQVDTSTAAVDTGPVTVARLGTQQSLSELYAGDLDEVRIYQRVLPLAEVKALAGGME
jgi:concanavalin A-like lectin/glucanase superfamily protein